LGLLIPALFYPIEFILVDSNNNVVKQAFGAKNDGMPGLSLGVNKKFAWGATALYADGKDIFV
jgi:acyl-homoserine lactone acylase PvdQ